MNDAFTQARDKEIQEAVDEAPILWTDAEVTRAKELSQELQELFKAKRSPLVVVGLAELGDRCAVFFGVCISPGHDGLLMSSGPLGAGIHAAAHLLVAAEEAVNEFGEAN